MAQPDDTSTADNPSPDAGVLDLSDKELLDNTRAGSVAAFDELWKRHAAFGLIAANAQVAGDGTAVNTSAWLALLNDVRAGQPLPAGVRRALYAAERTAAADAGPVTPPPVPAEAAAQRQAALMGQALATLPGRWQEVLWYRDVERMSPDDVALLTGLDPADIPTTQTRARRGLSDAWLQVNADAVAADSTCRWVRQRLRAYQKQTLPAGDATTVSEHVAACPGCQSVLQVARTMGARAPELLLAASAGPAAAAALTTYEASYGPIVINNDPLPTPVLAAFTAEAPPAGDTQTADDGTAEPPAEDKRRNRRALWIALLILVALGAALYGVIRLGGAHSAGPATTPPTTVPTTSLPPTTATPTTTPTGTTPATASSTATPPTTPATTPTKATTTPTTAAPTTTAPTKASTTATPTKATTTPTTPKPPPTTPAQGTGQGVTIGSVDTGGGMYAPVLSGRAAPGDKVTVSVPGSAVTVIADANGDWTTAGTSLTPAPGAQTVTVKAASSPDAVAVSITLATPPSPQLNKSGDAYQVTLSGGRPGAQVQILGLDPSIVTLDGSGAYSGVVVVPPGTSVVTVSVRYYGYDSTYGPRFGAPGGPWSFPVS